MKPGRQVIICSKCSKPQSTHSSDRTLCHACKPKCTRKTPLHRADITEKQDNSVTEITEKQGNE